MMRIVLSLFFLLAPFLIYYFVIRPRLHGTMRETYTWYDSFWKRWQARFIAFRTWFITVLAMFLSQLPALLEQLKLVDLSWLGQWQPTILGATVILLLLIRAFSTTPKNEPTP